MYDMFLEAVLWTNTCQSNTVYGSPRWTES